MTTLDLPGGGPVREIVADENGRALLRTHGDLVHLWDPATGDLRPLQAPSSGPFPREATCLAITPDGRQGFSGHMDGTIIQWDLHQAELVRELDKHDMWVSSAVVSGPQLITASWDRSIRVRDLHTGRLEQVLDDHPARVDLVLAVPGTRSRIVGACANGSLVIWDRASGRRDGVIKAHATAIIGMTALASGDVATISWDRHLRLWDLDNRILEREFALDERPDVVGAVGEVIVVGTQQATLSAWRVDAPAPLARWTAAAAITTLATIPETGGGVDVIAGDASGAVHQLRLHTRRSAHHA